MGVAERKDKDIDQNKSSMKSGRHSLEFKMQGQSCVSSVASTIRRDKNTEDGGPFGVSCPVWIQMSK